MTKWKNLDDEKKLIISYCGELVLFAVVFIILGFLKIFKIINYSETTRLVFNYITLAGGAWGIADFLWALLSKKRREKVDLIDKILTLPVAISIIVYDLISLISKPTDINFYAITVGVILIYGGLDLMFQGIYHYYKPSKALLKEIEKYSEQLAEEKKKESEETSKEETKDE